MGQEVWLVVISVGVLAMLAQLFGFDGGDQPREPKL